MTNKSPANIGKVFPYSYFKCPCGPLNVLETTRAPKKINHPYGATGNEISNFMNPGSDMGGKSKGLIGF